MTEVIDCVKKQYKTQFGIHVHAHRGRERERESYSNTQVL
jgi:hypothetical protein